MVFYLVFLFGMIDFAGMPHDFATDRASTDDRCRALPVPSRGASGSSFLRPGEAKSNKEGHDRST